MGREVSNVVLLNSRHTQIIIQISFTIILLSYFLVWLPQPAVGLSFIGLELGEWAKFIPEVSQGDIIPSRNFFYLPPVTLALMLAFWTVRWSNRHWQTWLIRGTALLISFLAFPALESLQDEPASQWILRVLFIGVVGIAILLAAYYAYRKSVPDTVPWVYFVGFGLVGALLPLWTFLAIRPIVEEILGSEVGFGVGIILNTIGNGLVVTIGLVNLSRHQLFSANKIALEHNNPN